MAKKKEIVFKRRILGYDKRTLNISSTHFELFEKLMISRKIKKFADNGDIVYQKYSKNDLIHDLLFIYGVIVKSLKEDPVLQKEYPYKNYKPYYIVKFLAQKGLFPEGYEGGEIEVDEE